MAKTFENQASDFLEMWVGGVADRPRYFDLDTIQGLRNEHAIPEELLVTIAMVFEVAAVSYWQEANRAKTDNKARRKELQDLEKTTTKLVAVLDGLSPDTLRMLKEARIACGFQHHSAQDVVSSVVQSMMEPQSSDTKKPNNEVSDAGTFDHLREDLQTIADEARKTQKWAGAGKGGSKNDDSAQELMQACFLVWTEIIGRQFKLAWYKNGPDSDAARFCCGVAKIVDPEFSPSRIITASRKVRELGIGIKDLEKLSEKADSFSKRIE